MPKTLLLADDSVTIQKVVGISFASEDIEITTVDNGNDALAKARELRPDVILADVVMPGLSGYEVCEGVKADPSLRHIPVLLLTGTFEAFDEQRATAAGAAGHVAKPFEAQTLVDRVHQLLEAAQAAAARAPAAPAPAAAAPAVNPAQDDAFDFFAEDESGVAASDDFSASPLDLDGPDAAFAFDDEELAAAPQEPQAAAPLARRPAHDATVAMLPDRPSPAASADAFDFSFDDASAPAQAPLRPEALAHTTLLDPAAGSDLDVSSSDLAVDLSSGPGAATQVLVSPAEEEPDDFTDADFDLTEPEPMSAAPAASALPADPVMDALALRRPAPPADRTPRPFGAQPDPGDTLPRRETPPPMPAFPSAPMELDAMDAEALDDDAFEAEPMDAEPFDAEPMDAEPMEAEPLDDDVDADLLDGVTEPPDSMRPQRPAAPVAAAPERSAAGMTMDTLSPAMREEMRDTLEKIAWDAFGQVTEKVVREAIERIERAAWEVVPKLAETLIQEEIRRLKGGAD
jgi:CheY-like chemotaxis protein